MKCFMIPAFFIIEAENEENATSAANEMRMVANLSAVNTTGYLLFDEVLPNKQLIGYSVGSTELPHSYTEI